MNKHRHTQTTHKHTGTGSCFSSFAFALGINVFFSLSSVQYTTQSLVLLLNNGRREGGWWPKRSIFQFRSVSFSSSSIWLFFTLLFLSLSFTHCWLRFSRNYFTHFTVWCSSVFSVFHCCVFFHWVVLKWLKIAVDVVVFVVYSCYTLTRTVGWVSLAFIRK